MSSRKDWLTFAAVMMVAFLSCAGIALPYPILAPMFIDAAPNGMNSFAGLSSEWLLGFALAIYPLGIFIGGSFIGALSDTYGRKSILQLTLLISVLGYGVSAYAISTENYVFFLLARFFTGLCEGNVSIARAIALDLTETIDKTKAMSVLNAAIFSGWLLGPLAGGFLAVYGPEVAFWAAGLSVFLCALLVQFSIHETHKRDNAPAFTLSRIVEDNSLRLLKHPALRSIFLIQLSYTLAVNAFYEFYPVWLVSSFDYQPADIGTVTAMMTTMMTLSSLFIVSRLEKWLGQLTTMVIGLSCFGLAVGLLPFTANLGMFSLFLLCGVMIAVYNGVLPGYAVDSASDQGHGAIMGLLTMTFCLANAIIAIVGSALLHISHSAPLIVALLLSLLASAMLIRFDKQMKQGALKEPTCNA